MSYKAYPNKPAYRVRINTVTQSGSVLYKLQVRCWWGWRTLESNLFRNDLDKALNELLGTPWEKNV